MFIRRMSTLHWIYIKAGIVDAIMQTEVKMKNIKGVHLFLTLAFLLAMILGTMDAGIAQTSRPQVFVVTLEGPLTPVWSGVLQRGIAQAERAGAELLVIELNTPGGGVDLMNNLVQEILASPVPVAVFVSPRGGMAASAGTLLVLAGQIAAMTPESAIGAASPIGMQGEDLGTTAEVKTKEILKASVRSLAARRGESAVRLAESAIENSEAATAEEALQAGLIDVVANDLTALLQFLDGRTVTVNGVDVVLDLDGALVNSVDTTMVEDVLGLLTNPNIVFLLLSIGVQALLIEISSPGGWVAGFIGATLLALAVYGLGILPVNWFGLIFLLLAFILFILDIKAPTHGALTAAGTGSFIAGALILFNSAQVPGFSNVSVPLVIGVGLFIGLTFLAVVLIAVRAMKTPIVTGRESLAGKTGITITKLNPRGEVQVAGERWSALTAEGELPIAAGKHVEVVQVDGVKLIVKKME